MLNQAIEYAHRVNPDLAVMQVSAKTGEGLREWQEWIRERAKSAMTYSS